MAKGFKQAASNSLNEERSTAPENIGSINNERAQNTQRYYDELLPKSKKKSYKGLIIGIAAAIIACIGIGSAIAIQNLRSGADTSYVNPNPQGYLGATGSLDETSNNSNNSQNINTNNYAKTKDESSSVFNGFADYAHNFETQQIPLIGMSSDEAGNYDKTTISFPAEMEGEDKNFVGSINPDGTNFKWKSSHNKGGPALGKCSVNIKYGELDSVLKSYLNDFKEIYNEATQSYVVTYDSSKYKASSSGEKKKEEKLTFKEMCQKSFDDIQQTLQNSDEDYTYTNNEIYLNMPYRKIQEYYYYSSGVCAIEMIIKEPLHTSTTIKMMKAVNCGDCVRVIYSEYFKDNDLYQQDLEDLYEIEQTMKNF